jgi:3-oxoacyl-[acyl-carrier protein] reductase
MNLNLKDKLFIVGGATAGFGGAVARRLLDEGAKVIAIARNADKLHDLKKEFPTQAEPLAADITKPDTVGKILDAVGNRFPDGLLVNAGGPPAKSFLETNMEDWDTGYATVLRWKIDLIKALLPKFKEQKYGRIAFVESVSVKQPVENLVLSNSLRMAVVGFVKTLSQEIGKEGITLNILAPGFHDTDAVKRVLTKKSEVSGMSYEQVQQKLEQHIPVGRMGDPAEFASIAVWLLSPVSGYITGQTISVDGGVMAGSFG